jgi:hypothetical protein
MKNHHPLGSRWWLFETLRVAELARRRPLLWRRNMNEPDNSAADNSHPDAGRHLRAKAEAGHSKPHANVRIKTEYGNLVK